MNAVIANRALVAMTVAAWLLQVAYFVFPLDLIPDFVPLLGWFDDLAGLTGTLSLTWYTVSRLREAGELLPDTEPEVYEPLDPMELRRL